MSGISFIGVRFVVMKWMLFFVFALFTTKTQAQSWVSFDLILEEPQYDSLAVIDTTNYPDNIWQIGNTEKLWFDSVGRGIMTDTVNYYPVNNVSVFTVKLGINFYDWKLLLKLCISEK